MATRRSTRQRKRKAEQDQEPSLPAEDSDPDNLNEEQDSDSDADGDVAMSASTASRRAPSTRKSKRRKAEVSYDGDPDSDSNDDNEDDSDDDKDDGLCVCGGGEDAGPMIGCDGCQSWLHLACVGLSESSPELEAEQYFCPDCYRAQQEPKHKTKKPTKTKRKRSSTSASSKRSKTLSSSSSSSSSSTPTDLAAKLKKLPAKEIREMLERRGEMHARRSKKPEMVRHLVQLRVGLPNPEAMALVVNSESLLDLILRFVDAPDLFQCARVSRRWARAAVRPELWIPFLGKWGRLVRVPDGFGRAATADVLAAAYLNHYETGQMGVSSYCKCVLEPTDAQRTSLKDLAYVHEPTQTWFALTTCASCDRYQLGPADAQSRYRIRFKDTELEPEVTTTWWRHHPTHHYRFEGLEMQRYAAAKYGGATNIRRYSRWKSLGGKVADKPAFAYDTDKVHEWDWAKPPRVVKLPGSIVAISTAPIVRAAVADLHKRGVIRTKTDAAWSLAEDGLFECLEEGCSVRMDPDNEVYWSNKKLICAQGRCAEHCSGGELCAYHDALAHKDALAQNMLALPAPSEFAPNTKSALRNNAWVKLRKADYRACKTCWEVGSTRKFSPVATVVDDEPLCVKHGLEERFGDNLPSGLSAARARKLLLNSASLCVTCFAAGKTTAISDHPACDKCRDCCLEARGKDQPEAHRWYYIVPEGTCTHWLPLREIVNCAAGYDAAQRLKAMTGHDLLAWDEAHGRAESGEICRWCFDSQRITDSFDGASGLCGDHALSKWYSASEAKTLSDDQKVRVIEAGRRACLKCLKDDDEVVVTSVCTKHLCRSCCLSASLEDTMLHSSRGGQKHLNSGKWCTHWKPLSEFVTLADVGLTARQPRPEGLPSYSYWSSRLGPSARWLESARAQDGHHWTAQMRIAKRKLKKEQLCLECLGAGQLTNKSRLPCKEHSSGEVPKKSEPAKKGKAKKGKN